MMFDMGNKTPLLAVLLAVVSAGVFTDYYANLWTRLRSTLGTYPSSANYTVQLFSTDPVVLHVRDFMSEDEINHVLSLA